MLQELVVPCTQVLMQRRHSRRGSWFGKKEDLKLTPEQKRRSKMTAKVDPTKAITEDEPCMAMLRSASAHVERVQLTGVAQLP